MDPLFDLQAMSMQESRKNTKVTILFRENGTWPPVEVNRLVNNLRTVVSGGNAWPEYLLLYGEHTKAQALAAIGGGVAFTAETVTGMNHPKLPFTPNFI